MSNDSVMLDTTFGKSSSSTSISFLNGFNKSNNFNTTPLNNLRPVSSALRVQKKIYN